jgi:ribosomal protein S27AE
MELIRERLNYNAYVLNTWHKSVLLPGKMFWCDFLKCPKCNTSSLPLNDNEKYTCKHCHLTMQRFDKVLVISNEQECIDSNELGEVQ